MNEQKKTEVRLSIIEALEKWSDDHIISLIDMYWSENTIARMADAVLNVLLAPKEAQEAAKEENE